MNGMKTSCKTLGNWEETWKKTCMGGECKENRARLISVVPGDKTRGNGLREHQDTLFQYEGDRALAQVAQKGCGVSIIG